MRYKFQRKIRLATKPQFRQVFKKTKQKLSTELFDVYYYNNNLTYPRVGIIVSKRNINKASKRNQIKRVIREWFRLNQNKLKPVDMVVLVNKKAGISLKRELDQNLTKRLSELIL